jgi:polysaccharide export outer membrane protein
MIRATLPRALPAALRLALLATILPAICLAQAPPDPKIAVPAAGAQAASPRYEYLIAPGDVLRISVFQSPDLSLETRVGEDGTVSYPLVGSVPLSGASVTVAEQRIARMLREGGFIVAPHVTVVVVQVRGTLVTVLGMVAKPGRFPLDASDSRVTDLIALAGGVVPGGGDIVVLTGTREGKPMRREIDLLNLANSGDASGNVRLQSGDLLYVNRAPSFYIYGEVQRPGTYRLERAMTVIQALATGGGLTAKGTQRALAIHRRGADGAIKVLEPRLDDTLIADDVLYIRESIF